MQFYAHHGVYEAERQIGNAFVVDVAVSFLASLPVHDLQHTVNYEQLYQIVQQEMQQPQPLLEQLAQAILSGIRAAFPFVKKIEVKVYKKNPPLSGAVQHSSVHLQMEF